MNVFRKKRITLFFLAFTGLTFLNMSFFLAEISAMKDSYGKVEIENIAKLLSVSLAEEEQDTPESSETHGYKTLDLVSHNLCHLQLDNAGVSIILKSLGGSTAPHSGFYRIFTPPPDLS